MDDNCDFGVRAMKVANDIVVDVRAASFFDSWATA